MKKKKNMFLLVAVACFAINISITSALNLPNLEIQKNNYEQAKITSTIAEIMEKDSYPSYYGGTYISDDSNYVVLQIVEENIPKEKKSVSYTELNKVINMNSNVKIEYVKNSYKDLNDINDQLVKYYSSEGADISNLGSHYVDIFNNVVVVELIDNDATKVNSLKKSSAIENSIKSRSLNSDIIVFSKGEKQHNHASLQPGQAITTNGIPNNCSMGYRVKVLAREGYITAGHCFSKSGETATGGTVKKWKESGTVDAAFVQIENTNLFSLSNGLYYPNGNLTYLNNTLTPVLSVNQVIAKVGFKTGYTAGKIKNLNYSGNYDGIYFTNLIAADYETKGGDSGGAVFVPINASANAGGGVPLAGINKGTSSYGSAFVNAEEIYKAFIYTRY